MKVLLVGAAAVAVVVTSSALAAHGKVGLWQANIQTSGLPGMPSMANLPPEVAAQMKARGITMGAGGTTITTKFCMTAAQVASDKPITSQNNSCTTQNVKIQGNTMSADVICTGQMNSRGHIVATWSSLEHYSAVQNMDMVQQGQTVHTTMNINAQWLSPNCGSVH